MGSAAANAGLPGQIFNSVERQNVGITLDMVVPQVSEGDYVKLNFYEEVSNVVNGTATNALGPTTTLRSASTEVFVCRIIAPRLLADCCAPAPAPPSGGGCGETRSIELY
ncbi:MAG: hypothetical protein ACLQAT_25660 [Candidatus Binataceae bacterium]